MNGALRDWRETRKLSVGQAAAVVGVTAAMWSRWENSRRRIPAERVSQLRDRTGIPPHELRPDLFGDTPNGNAANGHPPETQSHGRISDGTLAEAMEPGKQD